MTHDSSGAPLSRRAFGTRIALGAAALAATPDLTHALGESAGGVHDPSTAGAATPAMPATPSLAQEQDPMMRTMQRFVDDLADGNAQMKERIAPSRPRQIAMMAYPGMYPLDLLGPLTVFSDLLNTNVHLVWKTKMAVPAGRGVVVNTIPFAECPEELDVLFVPGGTVGTIGALGDAQVLDFLRARAPKAKFVSSVCTGSLVLGAAGLLRGYRATSHWLVHDLLSTYGATPVKERVVQDRNRITAAGVTAGLDFALYVTAQLAGENYAKAEQLNIEYDPAPLFDAGNEAGAGPLVSGAMRRMYATARQGFEAAVKR
ncbi:MAG: DJ-1/PfpI family protein [Gemmatimonadetes bacterium]|nr:DJ-1/PfpI family protein [Gemmatimonadota bacterium]MBP7551614.1 DJ-1/PfpI family protein [Gemmatimonadaceae bacterium]